MAVLVAVELVLEGMAPSGSISVEHARNVLAWLNPCHPEQAETSRVWSQVPVADTARYDRLRPTHLDHVTDRSAATHQRCRRS
jgi:hypothetical protein